MNEKMYLKIVNDARKKVKKMAVKNNWLWFYNLHQKEVVVFAEKLLDLYPKADRDVVIIACWLHDIAHYYARTGEEILKVKPKHHIKGAEIAEKFLANYKVPKKTVEQIVRCILCHRNQAPYVPKTLNEKIVAVADAMSHLGSIFYFSYFKFHPNHSLERFAEDQLSKLERDWRDIGILPEAQKLVKAEYKVFKKLVMNFITAQEED